MHARCWCAIYMFSPLEPPSKRLIKLLWFWTSMNISIFGMGYVGCALAAGHSHLGHSIIAVDVNKEKLVLLAKGKSPIIEKDIESYLTRAMKKKLLRVTQDAKEAVQI